MKKILSICAAGVLCVMANAQSALVISQYFEGPSGTGNSKAFEIWNSGSDAITFSSINVLQLQKDTNGNGTFTDMFNLQTGTLAAGAVWVFANSEFLSTLTGAGIAVQGSNTNVNYNGDDVLRVMLAGSVTDMFGQPPDPGTAWSGGGVTTVDTNIQLKQGITTGQPAGWTNPSLRFEVAAVLSNPITAPQLAGLGVAPIPEPSTYAMLMGGAGLMFWTLRRRRTRG